MDKCKIFLADDHSILRTSLRLYLEQNGYEVVGEAECGADTLAKVPLLEADVVVLDITFPDIDGVQVAKRLLETKNDAKIIALTMHDESDYLVSFFQAGGVGYVNKSAASEELLQAIETVRSGRFYVSAEGMQVLAKKQAKGQETAQTEQILSERELEVLSYIARGYTCREIGEQLYLSTRTVETYRMRIMHKLQLKNRAELVNYAAKHGII